MASYLQRVRDYFLTPTQKLRRDGTNGGDRFLLTDKPTQTSFGDLFKSIAFFKESSDRAKVYTGSSDYGTQQGLATLSTNVQAKGNQAQLSTVSLVVQPHQLPTTQATTNDLTVSTVPSDGAVTNAQTLFNVAADGTATRNNFLVNLTTAGSKWLLRRILPTAGNASAIIIKNTSTDYDYSWDNLNSGTAAMNTLITQLSTSAQFITSVQNTFTSIINSSPSYFSDLTPVGYIQIDSSTTLPSAKWLRCDGTAISRATYPALFTKIGVSFGVGDGSTTFNLPDLRDRQATGYSGTKALASTGGADSHVIASANLPVHTHSLGGVTGTFTGTTDLSGEHSHTLALKQTSASCGDKPAGSDDPDGCGNASTDAISGGNHQHNVSGSVTLSAGNTGDGGFANTALDTKDAYLAVNMIIKVTP